jgi:asparagine synthase (glutamine-hydrolysing)
MGFFLLSREQPESPQGWSEAHARAGFDRRMVLQAGTWTLLLSGKLDGSGPHCVRDGPDFAACTGVFFYRGKRFEAGLASLLAEFDGRHFPWTDCRGHYAVVLYKGGRLWLAGDELGAYKIYRNLDGSRFSSAFSALRASLPVAEPDVQGVYEYVFNGATFGEKTLLRHVKQQRAGVLYSLPPSGPPTSAAPPARSDVIGHGSIDEAAEACAERLRALFRIYVAENRNFRTALSGGYDSRLILALLLDAGVTPRLYVYGRDDEADVRVAKDVARGQRLHLEQIDKDEHQRTRRSTAELAWTRFDGWNNAGLFDNGVDDEDRVARARPGVDILNGSGGEIFRNFFYLPDRSYRPEEIVWSFYSRYDPAHLTSRFRTDDYEGELAEDMLSALPGGSRAARLDRSQVEALYPLFRVRYWTGRDVGLNQRFGPLLFPFLEPAVISVRNGCPSCRRTTAASSPAFSEESIPGSPAT